MYKTVLFFRGKLSTSLNVKPFPRKILFYTSVQFFTSYIYIYIVCVCVCVCVCARARVRAGDDLIQYYGKWKLLGKVASE
jgi:hypothetical protein